MNKKDLDALKELYLSVYDEEQLNEAPGGKARFWDSNLGRFVANTGRTAGDVRDVLYGDPSGSASRDARQRLSQRVTGKPVKEYPDQRAARISRAQDATIASADKAEKEKAKTENPTKSPVPGAQPAGSPPSRPAGSPPSRPAGSTPQPRPAARPSGPVLSKKNGVEGTGVGADFNARAFTAAEKSRYSSVAAQNAAKSSAASATPKPSSPTPAASAPKPAIPTPRLTGLQKDVLDIRQMRSNSLNRQGDIASSQKLQTGIDVARASGKMTPEPGINNKKHPTPGTGATKPMNQANSYEWPSAKTIREIANAYSSIYEAKKKLDPVGKEDSDINNNDIENDPSDKYLKHRRGVRGAAIAKEEVELWVNELVEEGYDLSEYTWEDMFEIYEATAMAKRGYDETEIRNKIAKSTGGGEAADRATELENRPTFGNKSKQASREKLARTQRGDFRRTTSSDYGLRLDAHKSDDPTVKAKQKARGAQRSALTPKEKKQLNREAYEAYEFVASYLLENNFAESVEDANVIINNMSEGWFDQIIEGAAGDVAARAQKLANQRKGQTPKRKKMYQHLANLAAERERGPFQRGDTRTGMTTSDRDERRESGAYHDSVFGDGTRRTYGKGGVTKNPRKLAQQKARGQHAEDAEG